MSVLEGVTITGDRRRGAVVLKFGMLSKSIPAASVRRFLEQDGVRHIAAELLEALRVAEGR